MTLFYDPKTRDTKPWIRVVFILIPIVLVVVGFVIGQGIVKKKKSQKQNQETVVTDDIFKN